MIYVIYFYLCLCNVYILFLTRYVYYIFKTHHLRYNFHTDPLPHNKIKALPLTDRCVTAELMALELDGGRSIT